MNLARMFRGGLLGNCLAKAFFKVSVLVFLATIGLWTATAQAASASAPPFIQAQMAAANRAILIRIPGSAKPLSTTPEELLRNGLSYGNVHIGFGRATSAAVRTRAAAASTGGNNDRQLTWCRAGGVNFKVICPLEPGDSLTSTVATCTVSNQYQPVQVAVTLTPIGTSSANDIGYSTAQDPATQGAIFTVTTSGTAQEGEAYQLVPTYSSSNALCQALMPAANAAFTIVQWIVSLGPCDCDTPDNGDVGDAGDQGTSLADDIDSSLASDLGSMTLSTGATNQESAAILPGSGHVSSTTVDYQGPGLLKIVRYYSSNSGDPTFAGLLSSLSQATFPYPFVDLSVSASGNNSTVGVLDPRSPNGFQFTSTDGGATWTTESDLNYQLTYLSTANSNGASWLLTAPDGSVTQYAQSGTPLLYTARGGANLRYSSQSASGTSTTTITDDFGRSLVYVIQSSSQSLTETVTTPGNQQYKYTFDPTTGALEQLTYPDGSTRQFAYNAGPAGTGTQLLKQITDENGVVYRTFSYDGLGRATSSAYAGGAEQYGLSYIGFNSGVYQQVVTDPLGTQRTFSYQDNGFGRGVLAATSAPCNTCGTWASKSIGQNGLIVQGQDAAGNITAYNYDYTRNLPLSITNASGTSVAETTSYTWNATFPVPTEVDEPGRKTVITYDGAGNVLTRTVTDTATSNSRTWTYSNYTAWGQPQTIDGPRTDVSDVTSRSFYPIVAGNTNSGQLHAVTDPLGHTTTFNSYDGDGHVLQVTDPNGVVTQLSYWPRGWLKSIQVASQVTNLSYWPTGQLETISFPSGASLSYTYNAAHQLTDVYDQLNDHIHYTLDGMGNHVQTDVYDPAGTLVRTHQRAYDSLSRLWKDIGAYTGETTVYGYDADSNLNSVIDPLNHQTAKTYDALNRLAQVTDAGGGITTRSYNGLNQLVNVADPRTLNTKYATDALGNVSQLVSPDSGTSNLTYDAAGNVLSHTDAKGQDLLYQYDALNRPTQVKRSDTGQVLDTYTYDQNDSAHGAGIGRLTSMTDLSGTTNWSYDALGHMLSSTVVIGSQSLTTSYSYNSTTGNLQSMTLPSGKVVAYTWTSGQISAVTLSGSPLVSSIAYEPFGGPLTWTLANGETDSRGYDLDGRISADPVESITYDYASRVNGWTQSFSSALGGTQGFGYDALNRVTSYTGTGGPISYTYDANGNRLTQVANGTTTAYTIDPASNRVTQQSAQSGSGSPKVTSVGYDANGSMTSFGAASLTYDVQGHATNFSAWPFAGIYTYNGLNQRVEKQAGLNTLFVYDQASHLLGEYTTNGTPNDEIIYLGDIPVAVAKPGATYYVHADYRNTPRQIDNSTKAAVWEWDPTPFGDNQPNQQPSGSNPTFGFSLRFPGQYYDGESSLNKNMYRDYYSAVGRYTESDPIGLRAGTNTYAYVGGNPLKYIDPRGLDPFDDVLDAAQYPLTGGSPEMDSVLAQEAPVVAQDLLDTIPFLVPPVVPEFAPMSPAVCKTVAGGILKGLVSLTRMADGSAFAPEVVQTEMQELQQIEFLQNQLPGGINNPVVTLPNVAPPIGGR